MSGLGLQLLGPFNAIYDGRPLSYFRTKAVQALLVYLVCQPEGHRRESLMALLWPELSQSSAQNSLRQALHYLRRAVPEVPARNGREPLSFLLADRQIVQINPEAAYDLDVADFETGLRGPQEGWPEAVGLYRGDFLEDYYLPDSAPFEEWVLSRRADLRRQVLDALDALVAHDMSRGAYESAERLARRQLAIDDLHDRGHQNLMEILGRRGRRSQALSHYNIYCQLQDEALGVAPPEASQQLIEQIRLGELAPSGEQVSLPVTGLAARPVRRHNLRPQPTRFIGRERELRELEALIAGSQTRLVNIVGPGGMGKSRLALAFAEWQFEASGDDGRPNLADGVFFIALQPLRGEDEMITAIAQELDFPFDAGEKRSLKEQLLDFLREKQLMLILDNFEHLLEQVTLLSEILAAAPGLILLVTSRERLNLYEEQVYPLEGLAFPGEDEAIRPQELAMYPSVELFLERARLTLPGYSGPPEDARHLAELARLTAGMPLALELAASWIDVMSPAQIAAEIRENYDFLAAELQNVPERHRSMQAVFDSAWKRLSAGERSAMAQLSVFRGDFTAQAAAAVARADRPMLAGLARKSMLPSYPQSGRYQMHELLRQYAERTLPEQLSDEGASPPEAAAQYRHSIYYCQALGDWEKDLKSIRQPTALEAVETDMGNIRAAWLWAATGGLTSLLAQAAESLAIYIECRGNQPLGEQLFGLAVRALKEKLAGIEEDTSLGSAPEVRLVYATMLANYCRTLDYHREAQRRVDLAEESLLVLEQLQSEGLDTRLEQAKTWGVIQVNHQNTWRLDQALQAARKSLTLSQAVGDEWGSAAALLAMGITAKFMDEFAQSETWLEASLTLQRRLGNRFGEAEALVHLAHIAGGSGDWEGDARLSAECLAILESLGNERDAVPALTSLAVDMALLGRFEEAETRFGEAMARARRLGDAWSIAKVTASLASLKEQVGHYDEAAAMAHDSLVLARDLRDPSLISFSLRIMSTVAVGQQRYEEASRLLRERQNAVKSIPRGVDMGLICQAYVALGLRDYPRAAGHLTNTIRSIIDKKSTAIVLLWSLPAGALLLARQGHAESALALYTAASGYPFVGNSRWFDDVVGAPLRGLARRLPPVVVLAAEERGRETDMWQAGAWLLEELEGHRGVAESSVLIDVGERASQSDAKLLRRGRPT